MLISDLAVRDLQWQKRGLLVQLKPMLAKLARIVQPLAPSPHRHEPASLPPPALSAVVAPVLVPPPETEPAPAAIDARRWRRHPQLRGCDGARCPSARHAQLAAIRGIFNARSGDYEAARLAFAEAARDASLDLATQHGFWDLPRAGLIAAVLAYEDAGRLRDATALAAHLRTALRPRLLAPLPTPEHRASAR